MSISVGKSRLWSEMQNKQYAVIESAMERANRMAGKKFSFHTAHEIARTICKFAFREFKRSLSEKFPSEEYSSSLKLAFSCSEHLLLGKLYQSVMEVLFPQEAEDLKDRSIKTLPPDASL